MSSTNPIVLIKANARMSALGKLSWSRMAAAARVRPFVMTSSMSRRVGVPCRDDGFTLND